MELKWLMICFAIAMGTLGITDAIQHYQKGQCRIEAIKAHMDVDKIDLVCRK